jgi:hypothetical protein
VVDGDVAAPLIGKDGRVPIDRSELASTCELLVQLTRRIATMGELAESEHRSDLAKELFSAERALEGARRRLERLSEARPTR